MVLWHYITMIEINDSITILTRRPLAQNYGYLLLRIVRHPIILFKEIVRRKSILGGHPAVTSSLLEGLKGLGMKYNYDPIIDKKITTKAVVLSDPEALRLCIKLKEKGDLSVLFAGPNVMVRADDFDSLYSNKNIDRILVPSKWVEYSYQFENPDTKNRMLIWPSGIDVQKWKPIAKKEYKSIVLYEKYPRAELKKDFYKNIITKLRKMGYRVIRIKYGQYNEKEYKAALISSSAMIYVSKSESQGIALLESWAMNIPTFVWDSDFKKEGDRVFKDISPAPYLDKATGKLWKSINDLEGCLDTINKEVYRPRIYASRHFTNEKSAKLLIDEINRKNW